MKASQTQSSSRAGRAVPASQRVCKRARAGLSCGAVLCLLASACGDDAAGTEGSVVAAGATGSVVDAAAPIESDTGPSASPAAGAAAPPAAAGAPAAGSPAAAGGGAGGTATAGSMAMAPAASTAGAPSSPTDAGAPAAGSGGTGGSTPAAALGPDCDIDPLASESTYGSGFSEQFRGLFGCTTPADLALFREMLPAKFEMPTDPQVCFYAIDFIVGSLGPYHEVAILLPVTYAGESGKYVLSMALDSSLATSGGRAIGFPKYLTEVTFEQRGNDWAVRAGSSGRADFAVSYVSECVAEDTFLWPDFINLTPIPQGETSSEAFLPPRTGSALRVPAEYLTDPKYYSLGGSVQVEIADDLPWNGLIDESKPFPGVLTTFKGGIDLGNQPLD